jgi:hypothetical protein
MADIIINSLPRFRPVPRVIGGRIMAVAVFNPDDDIETILYPWSQLADFQLLVAEHDDYTAKQIEVEHIEPIDLQPVAEHPAAFKPRFNPNGHDITTFNSLSSKYPAIEDKDK